MWQFNTYTLSFCQNNVVLKNDWICEACHISFILIKRIYLKKNYISQSKNTNKFMNHQKHFKRIDEIISQFNKIQRLHDYSNIQNHHRRQNQIKQLHTTFCQCENNDHSKTKHANVFRLFIAAWFDFNGGSNFQPVCTPFPPQYVYCIFIKIFRTQTYLYTGIPECTTCRLMYDHAKVIDATSRWSARRKSHLSSFRIVIVWEFYGKIGWR